MATLIRIVSEQEQGLRLDQFLARQPEVQSRGRARLLLDSAKVQVPGHKVRPGLELEAGMQVAFDAASLPSLDRLHGQGSGKEPPRLVVLHEDASIVVIDKPPGLVSHPPEGKSFAGHSVASAAAQQFGVMPSLNGEDRPGIVHRLDKDTSGVMVLARTEAAFAHLREQWQDRTVDKEYRCLCFGHARFDSDWIDRPIAVDPAHPERMAVVPESGREAQTYYEVVERFAAHTHFLCRPKTGRTHQIRVHMTSIGHSLLGDRVYKSRRVQHEAWPEAAPPLPRQCLHAHRLGFVHPASGQPVVFEAPLPDDMTAALAWLRAQEQRRR